jgi:hypothetical protein
MARYFIHIFDGRNCAEDEEGFEADGPAAARAEIRRLVVGVIRDLVADGQGPDGQYVELRDEQNKLLDVLAFKDVLGEVPL